MSFAMTTAAVLERRKTVTRRLGWSTLKPGTLLQPIEKGQGLQKGAKVVKVGGPIRVVDVRRERLFERSAVGPQDGRYGADEAAREGFPAMLYGEFVTFFMAANACAADQLVTRIEFTYE